MEVKVNYQPIASNEYFDYYISSLLKNQLRGESFEIIRIDAELIIDFIRRRFNSKIYNGNYNIEACNAKFLIRVKNSEVVEVTNHERLQPINKIGRW